MTVTDIHDGSPPLTLYRVAHESIEQTDRSRQIQGVRRFVS